MRVQISDFKLASIAAVFLTSLAMLVVFGFNPGGFETRDVWFLILLPAGLLAYPLSDLVYKMAPRAEPVMFWILMSTCNFLWYWALSLIAVKVFRSDSTE